MLSKFFTVLSIFFSYILRGISWLIPRDPLLWIFIGWHQNGKREIFADNSKYLFLYASKLTHNHSVWIAQDEILAKILRNQGYEAYNLRSLRGTYYSLRAGVTFIDAYFKRENWRLAGGSTAVQLWHGKGFKKVGYDSPSSLPKYNRLLSPELFSTYDYAIASSPYVAKMMSQVLRITPEKVLITGLPRNDVFFADIPGSEIDAHPKLAEIFSASNQPQGGYILFAPTFRRSGKNPVDRLDLDSVQNYLEAKDTRLIIALHPKHRGRPVRTNPSKRIVFIDPGYDLYPFLKRFDILITDYSSLFIEFVLLDKHTVFFTYDLEEYKNTTGLYDDFERLLPGPLTKNTSEMLRELENSAKWKNKRTEVREILFTQQDGEASARIAQHILNEKRLT